MEKPNIYLLPSQEPNFHDQFVNHIGRGTFKDAFDSKKIKGYILLKFREFSVGRFLMGYKIQLQPDDISKHKNICDLAIVQKLNYQKSWLTAIHKPKNNAG